MYKIYRYYANGKKRLIYRRVNKDFARIWVKNPKSRGVTKKGVAYVDGYLQTDPLKEQESSMTPIPKLSGD